MDTCPQLADLMSRMADKEPTNLPTPASCTADFCLIPLDLRNLGSKSGDSGTPTASVSKEVAEVQRLLKKSGVKYSMHSAGTTLEGPWDQVMQIIGQCHAMLHARGIVRIQSDIRVGSRTDKKQGFEDKVAAVEKLLAEDREEAENEDDEQITYER